MSIIALIAFFFENDRWRRSILISPVVVDLAGDMIDGD
jgi:hypothetical protein